MEVPIYEIVASLPGVRLPFKTLTEICDEEGAMSLMNRDYASGQVPLNLKNHNLTSLLETVCYKYVSTTTYQTYSR